MKNPFERFKIKKSDVKVAAGIVTALASANNLKAANTTEMPRDGSNSLNISYDNPTSFYGNSTVYGLTPKPMFRVDITKKKETLSGGEPEGEGVFGVGEGNPISLASAYFKTGTVEYVNPAARESAKNDIRAFLRTVDLKNSKIIVTGYSSKERPTPLNLTLAQQRTAEGMLLVQEILDEDYPGISIVRESVVASDASVYDGLTDEQILEIERIKAASPAEFQKLIDQKQAISIDAVTIEQPSEDQPPETVTPLENYGYIVIDGSQSMANDVADVRAEVERIKHEKDKTIRTVLLEGGNQEAHLTTLENLLRDLKGPFNGMKILVVTDEPDNKVSKMNYEYNISHVLGLARDKKVDIVVKVFNPDKVEGGYKTFLLNRNRAAFLSPDHYTEGALQRQWYKSLPNENI